VSDIESLRDMMIALLARESSVTCEFIKDNVNRFAEPFGDTITSVEKEDLIRFLESQFDVTMRIGAILQEEFTPWLDAAKNSIDPFYWDRYRKLLEQKGFGLRVIPKLDQVTDKILGLLENPEKEGAWERKGLVVGHVQSGKTANYTGMICKAADAGYRLIIVIAGIHNNLRSQTQARVDEGFVGRDSSRLLRTDNENRYIGVGRYDHSRIPITLTNTASDFKKNIANMLGMGLDTVNVPVILVIKKNKNTLENLIDWLRVNNTVRDAGIENHPMLMIDDEADNASINTSANPDEATKINSLIRTILNLFHKRCYVGYTATPFANIFIDPDSDEEMIGSDLFPRDFIVSLDAPSSYMGAERIFGEDNNANIVRYISDYKDLLPIRHRIDHTVIELPPSIYQAAETFVLVIAQRILRGYEKKHNSMLVNASRFTNVQSQIRNLLHEHMEDLKRQIRFNYKLPRDKALNNSVMNRLHQIWDSEFDTGEFSWDEVQTVLNNSVSPIKIIEINSRSSETLDYENYSLDGLNVIAIGGFSLSRGLTLEGLSVSYFLRNSIMYDTLMQMGRWFGYRPGYEDLCRVFMPGVAAGWYAHISEVTEELRDEFREMELANLTPKHFGLKIRSHPDSLIVTARNKMRSGETVYRQIDLSEKLIETDKLFREIEKIELNRKVFTALLTKLIGEKQPEITRYSNYLWKEIPVDIVLNFINAFNNHPASLRTQTGPVSEYIMARKNDELKLWDVVFINKAKAVPEDREKPAEGIDIGWQIRSEGSKGDAPANCIIIGKKARVGQTIDEMEGLSETEINKANENWNNNPEKSKNITGRYFRGVRSRPLLMIHLLKIKEESSNRTVCEGVVAYGISFSKSLYSTNLVRYVVNTTWWKNEFGDDLEGDEDE
jgi:hypothetical protein